MFLPLYYRAFDVAFDVAFYTTAPLYYRASILGTFLAFDVAFVVPRLPPRLPVHRPQAFCIAAIWVCLETLNTERDSSKKEKS